MRRFWTALLLVAFWALPVAAERAHVHTLLSAVTVATGTPNTVSLAHPGSSRGYLVVTTASEVGTASLQVSAQLAGTGIEVCGSSGITTETTTTYSIDTTDSAATGGPGSAVMCDFPLAFATNFVFTVTGAASSFDITATMYFLPE